MRLYSASSKIVSIDSFLASPMKPHVLTTMTSASSGSSTIRHPPSPATPSMTSLSTRFLTQPRLTKKILRCDICELAAGPAGPHRGEEPLEQIERVVRSRRRLRMVLHAEGLERVDRQPLGRPVVEVHVRRASARRERREIDAEAVVLRRNLDAPSRQVLDGLIGAAVTELELVGLRPERDRQQLVAQADAED